jgi:hypothetical protein
MYLVFPVFTAKQTSLQAFNTNHINYSFVPEKKSAGFEPSNLSVDEGTLTEEHRCRLLS